MSDETIKQIFAPILPTTDNPAASSLMQIAMTAHAVAITNATEMRLHREECKGREERTEKKFDTIAYTMKDMGSKLDKQTETLTNSIEEKHRQIVDDNKYSNRLLYMIVSIITAIGAILGKVPVSFHF